MALRECVAQMKESGVVVVVVGTSAVVGTSGAVVGTWQ